MRALLEEWRPDVVLREPAELASYVAGTEREIPHVQTNIGLGEEGDGSFEVPHGDGEFSSWIGMPGP
jgi:hypothetical protein